jgi:hypothetical protein
MPEMAGRYEQIAVARPWGAAIRGRRPASPEATDNRDVNHVPMKIGSLDPLADLTMSAKLRYI